MPSQVVFWLLLGCWALALVVAGFKLAFDVLAADARGARLPARSLLSAVRTGLECGAVFTSVVVSSAIFEAINELWDLRLKLSSYDLSEFSGSAKRVVLVAGVWISCMMVFRVVERLLDKYLPKDPANPAPTAGNSGHGGGANGQQPLGR